ncbi:MAG: hypothetical protein ACREGC_02390 [Minisyncoccia bacterium]
MAVLTRVGTLEIKPISKKGDTVLVKMFDVTHRHRFEDTNELGYETAYERGIVAKLGVVVDRTLTPEQILFRLHPNEREVDLHVLRTIPRIKHGVKRDPVEVTVFCPGRYVYSIEELWADFHMFGLVPDFYAQAQMNARHPSFAEKHENGMMWFDQNEGVCFAEFHKSPGDIRVGASDRPWRNYWCYAGVPIIQ